MIESTTIFGPGTSLLVRIGIIVVVALAAHLLVVVVRRLSTTAMSVMGKHRLRKARAVITLMTSVAVFATYFGALGFILNELGVSLTGYLASASVLALAIGFGSQGVVQDVVSGLTIVLADIFDVGDMVKIGDEIGIVKEISMRYCVIENALGARTMIPNRSITNVSRYPRGYVRALLDVTLPNDTKVADKVRAKLQTLVNSVLDQYASVFRAPPEILGDIQYPSGKLINRTKFRIWPGRGEVLETAVKDEIINTLKSVSDTYEDWMVTVNYEVEQSNAQRDSRSSKNNR